MWPNAPTCHADERHYSSEPDHWRPPRHADADSPYQETYRTCSYCGSIHPEDLYDFLRELPYEAPPQYRDGDAVVDIAYLDFRRGLESADWKYGWPHKFYVNGIPNPIAGRDTPTYTTGGDPDRLRERYGTEPEPVVEDGRTWWRLVSSRHAAPGFLHTKWYNRHLKDLTPDAFDALAEELRRHSGIAFHRGDDGRLGYRTGAW